MEDEGQMTTKLPYSEERLAQKINEAMGAASSCWDNLEGAGEFDSDRCSVLAQQLLEDVKRLTAFEEPRLGLASNRQLIDEVDTRKKLGHLEDDYRTIDG